MKASVLALLPALLGGCATIVTGTSRSVNVTATDVTTGVEITGARCRLKSSRVSARIRTPGIIRLKRSRDDVQVRCRKQGYYPGSAVVSSDFQLWSLANLLFGAWPLWFGIDLATGAINDYDRQVDVGLSRETGSK